jgi:hypothetical protein
VDESQALGRFTCFSFDVIATGTVCTDNRVDSESNLLHILSYLVVSGALDISLIPSKCDTVSRFTFVSTHPGSAQGSPSTEALQLGTDVVDNVIQKELYLDTNI